MIKAIFFDFDGVLTTDFSGSGRVCENLVLTYPDLVLEHVKERYAKHCKALMIGGSFSEVWNGFCADVKKEIPMDVLKRALRTISINEQMMAIADALRQKYKVGIVTNNPEERMELIDEDVDLSSRFDPLVVSGAVHVAKEGDSTAIYDIALRLAECSPSEALFIDNQQKNLVVPSAMGMHTYWHDDAINDIQALISALRNLGISID